MSVSIIIPAYNEELRLPATLRATTDYFAARDEPFEILVVDDGSTDSTPQLVADFASVHPELSIQCLHYGGNRGKGYAVRYGMLRAGGELRLFCDADQATPITEYQIVLEAMHKANADIAIGSRPMRESALLVHQPWYRELLGRAGNLAVRVVAISGIADTQCGFKLFTADAAQSIFSRCRIDRFAFDIEALYLACRLGYQIIEVPIRWADQPGSKVNMTRDSASALRDLFRIRWLHRTLKSIPRTAQPTAVHPKE